MKKIIILLITVVMIFSLGACGESKSENDKEVTDDVNKDDQNANVSDNEYKTYFEVVYNEDLLGAYKYFDENFENLSDEVRNEYLEELKKETLKRADSYKIFSEYVGVESQAPRMIEYVDEFYPNVFNSSDYLFNINTLDEEIKMAADELKNDDIFALCKAYWNTEGYIEDIGFAAVLRKDVADIITNRFGDSKDEILNNLNSYTDQVSGMDNSFETEARNPVVLLENVDKFNLFEGMNKIVLYVPLKIVDEPVIENDSSTIDDEDSSTADTEDSSTADTEDSDATDTNEDECNESDGPNNVGFNSGEDVIIGVIDGSDDDFTAIYLTDNYEEFVDDDVTLLYYPMDSRVIDSYEEYNYTVIIPLFVSSDMYDVDIEYSNYGEVLDNSSENKNIKAGTVLFKGILQGDGEAYKIRFKLEDGTEKEIYMTTDESDEAVLINGYLINIR